MFGESTAIHRALKPSSTGHEMYKGSLTTRSGHNVHEHAEN